jgi:hypothetical protein
MRNRPEGLNTKDRREEEGVLIFTPNTSPFNNIVITT